MAHLGCATGTPPSRARDCSSGAESNTATEGAPASRPGSRALAGALSTPATNAMSAVRAAAAKARYSSLRSSCAATSSLSGCVLSCEAAVCWLSLNGERDPAGPPHLQSSVSEDLELEGRVAEGYAPRHVSQDLRQGHVRVPDCAHLAVRDHSYQPCQRLLTVVECQRCSVGGVHGRTGRNQPPRFPRWPLQRCMRLLCRRTASAHYALRLASLPRAWSDGGIGQGRLCAGRLVCMKCM
jgi:hypothetical protein